MNTKENEITKQPLHKLPLAATNKNRIMPKKIIEKTMIMKTTLFLTMFLCATAIIAQDTEKIQWIDFETAIEKNKTDQKPIFIDMYTSWCGWCKKLDENTFSQKDIATYINANFHAVKFDAETTIPIKWNDSTYHNNYHGKLDESGKPYKAKSHRLAEILMNGRIAYPTVVFLVPEKDFIAPLPGYKTPEQLQDYLLYFGEKIYNLNLFEAYIEGMKTQKIVQ